MVAGVSPPSAQDLREVMERSASHCKHGGRLPRQPQGGCLRQPYVQELIGNLLPFRGLQIRRNERISGVRQPGQYEIDVAVEFFIADKLRFLLIVECKNWQRPVGRDVVQKLAQTPNSCSQPLFLRDPLVAHPALQPIAFLIDRTGLGQFDSVAPATHDRH